MAEGERLCINCHHTELHIVQRGQCAHNGCECDAPEYNDESRVQFCGDTNSPPGWVQMTCVKPPGHTGDHASGNQHWPRTKEVITGIRVAFSHRCPEDPGDGETTITINFDVIDSRFVRIQAPACIRCWAEMRVDGTHEIKSRRRINA